MPLSPGTRLGPYEILGLLGTGGMGEVYKATDTTLGRAVAIKVLPEKFGGDPERMARFEREARLLASLNHPHIASIYGVGSGDGVRFLAMELVEGDDLAVRIAHGPIPVAEAIEIARQVAEALEAAHEKGIIHRDLKPANVKLAADGQVKVLDFGLAKALDDETGTPSSSALSHSPTMTSPMTAAHVILGTAAYMSPEQARGKPVDRRADIWAFGCLLYECLTGRRAFAGETLSDTIAKILERDPELTALPRATPPRVRELLKRCLAKDAKLRLRDIGDARITLDEVLAARSPSGRLLPTDAPREAADRRTVILGALAGVVFGLLAGAAVWRMIEVPSGADAKETACVSVAMPEDLTAHGATITLDGRTLILNAKPKGSSGEKPIQNMVYTRPLDRYDWRPVAGTEGGLFGRATVDSRGILFFRPIAEGMAQKRLFRIPLDGSAPPTAIADVKDSWLDTIQMWNGDILVLDAGTSLVRIPAGGGPPSQPVRLDAGRLAVKKFELAATTLPGDRSLLVTVIWYDNQGYHFSVGVADLGTGKVKVIVEDGGSPTYVAPGFVVFARGSDLLAVLFDSNSEQTRGAPIAIWNGVWGRGGFSPGRFKVTSNGSLFYRPGQAGRARTLAVLDAAGNLKPWSAERYEVRAPPVVSPDGRRFACVITNGRAIDEIWISELDRPSLRRLGTDPGADCDRPVWSPDGSSIAYQRIARDGRDGVYVQSASGGEPRLVLAPETDDVSYSPGSFMPDGSALLATRNVPGGSGLVSITLAGKVSDPGRTHRIAQSEFTLTLPKISPDGRWLAYLSDETGKLALYVAAFHPDGTTGPPVRVAISGSWMLEWSEDGKALFFFNEDEHYKLWKVSVATRPTLAISPPVAVIDMDERGLGTGTVLPDGRFLVAVKGEGEDDLTRYNLVLNWTRELARKLQAAR